MSMETDQAVRDALRHPPALEKARSLANFANSEGGGLAGFEVTLTKEEGFALVEWIHDHSGLVSVEGMPQLEADMVIARRNSNPWVVLDNFTFYGLKTAPKRVLS